MSLDCSVFAKPGYRTCLLVTWEYKLFWKCRSAFKLVSLYVFNVIVRISLMITFEIVQCNCLYMFWKLLENPIFSTSIKKVVFCQDLNVLKVVFNQDMTVLYVCLFVKVKAFPKYDYHYQNIVYITIYVRRLQFECNGKITVYSSIVCK